MKKKYALTFAALALAAAGWSATVEKTLTFDADDLTFTQEEWGETTYDLVTIKDGMPYNDLGKPQLPMVRYSISLPFGAEVTAVEVIASDTDEVSGSYYLLPGQVPMRAGNPLIIYCPDWPEPWEFTPPDEETYASEDYFPADILVDDGAGDTRGYLTTDFHVFPLQYKPADRELRLYTSVTVRVTYTPPEEPPAATRYEWLGVYDQWGEGLKRSVLNADDVITNREPVTAVDVMAYGSEVDNGETIPWVMPNDSSYYEYNTPDAVVGYSDPEDMEYPFNLVVITNDKWWKNENEYETQTGLSAALEPYIEWRKRMGFPTKKVLVDTIVERVAGTDKQDKIRNFLKIAFERWGVNAAFFIGDTQADTSSYSTAWGRYGVVPSRFVCYDPPSAYIEASDYYYACLDGSWGPDPNNENGYFGSKYYEGLVLKPTISVGRMPVGGKSSGGEATTEFTNWLDKLLTYEKMPPAAYLDDVLFLGADFGYYDCKDLWLGNYFPGFTATHIYESTIGPGLENGDPWAVYPTYPEPHECLDALNAGSGFTVVATHGHPLGFYITTHGYNLNIYIEEFMVDRDVPAPYANNMVFATGLKRLTNGPRYGVLVADSCSTFRYYYRDDEDKECLGEEYLALANGGGPAYVGNTDAGTTMYGRPLTEDLITNLIGPTAAPEDDIYPLGLADVLAKFEFSPSTPNQDLYAHNVGGDPIMPVWTANPTALAMTYRYYSEGETYVLEAFIKDKDNNPLTGVTVNLWVDDLYYLTGETNETGKVRFKGLGAFENGKLTAWKHNYKPALADGVDVP